jgi:heterotetrameric sarcosine oxidase delta subunit
MSFLIRCPQCGERSVYEFRFGGEDCSRPAKDAPETEWMTYRYVRKNINSVQSEWWFHRAGCREWLLAVRDTVSNEVIETFLPGERPA